MSNNLKSSTAQIITNIDDCVSNPLQFISKKFIVNDIDRIAFQEVNEIWKNTPDLKHFREYKPHNWCKNRCCCFRWLKKGELSSDNDPNYTEHTLTCKKGNGCCLARNCCQLPHCRCTWFICQRNLSQEEKDYNRRFSEGATDKTKPENRPKSKCILVRYAFLVRLLLPLFWSLLVIVLQVYSVGNCSFAGFGTGNSTSITIKYVNDDESCGIGISNDAHNTVGLILAFLISFRASQAFDRFAKASEEVNGILNDVRDTVRQVMVWTTDDAAKLESWNTKKRLVGYLVAFAYATNAVLTDRDMKMIYRSLDVKNNGRLQTSEENEENEKINRLNNKKKVDIETKQENTRLNKIKTKIPIEQKKKKTAAGIFITDTKEQKTETEEQRTENREDETDYHVPYLISKKDLNQIHSGDKTLCPARAAMLATICVAKLVREQKLPTDPCVIPNIDANLSNMLSRYALLQRTKVPLPLFYIVHLGHLTLIYLYTLPFVLSGMIDSLQEHVLWVMPCIMLIVSYAFLGTEEISTMIENPFENRNECDLPVDKMCNDIRKDAIRMVKWYEHIQFPSEFERVVMFDISDPSNESESLDLIKKWIKDENELLIVDPVTEKVVATGKIDCKFLEKKPLVMVVKLEFDAEISVGNKSFITIQKKEEEKKDVVNIQVKNVTSVIKNMSDKKVDDNLHTEGTNWNIPDSKKGDFKDLQDCLRELDLIQYLDNFIENGVECIGDLIHITADDLMEFGLKKVNARKKEIAIKQKVLTGTTATNDKNDEDEDKEQKEQKEQKE